MTFSRNGSNKDIRKSVRAHRRQLPEPLQSKHAHAVCRHLFGQNNNRFQRKNIGVYLDFDGELATAPLIKRLRRCGARLYAPIVNEHEEMSFAPLLLCGRQTMNRFNIRQAKALNARIKPQAIDVLLTPLTAFDRQGRRIGMGAGYYDRCFAFKRRAPAKKPLMIGLAHAFQEFGFGVLQQQAWDVPLDFVADENGLAKCLYRGR